MDNIVYDSDQKIETREDAIEVFRQFFTEEKGYPPFNESLVYEIKDAEEKFVYNDQYGYSGVGGILTNKGQIIVKGYCK